ncbi:MAG: hypothetical protein Q9163_000968 [Psora crenata]
MLIPDTDAAELRKWIIKRLEAISADVDEDVLADYVIALLRSEAPEQQLRLDAYSNLEDFLKDDTKQLVDEVFLCLETKSYRPGYVPPPTTAVTPYTALPKAPPSSVPVEPIGGSSNGFDPSRKRPYNDGQQTRNGIDSHYTRGDRQVKQMRRGGRGRGDNFRGRGGRGGEIPEAQTLPYTGNPDIPPYFPNLPLEGTPPMPFNPNDPFAALAAFQAMGLPVPQLSPAGIQGHSNGVGRELCRDYETIGFCAKGNACPHRHGMDLVVVPGQDEYDPKNALLTDNPTSSPTSNGHGGTRGRAYGSIRGSVSGRGDRGGFNARRNNRAEFSLAGQNQDRSITTIVVEQIPEENFDEQSVRQFFSEFGNIEEVTMQPYKRLALVKYDDYYAARKAYESPKVIFDNRFVKVYWYKSGTLPTLPGTAKHSATSPSAATGEEQPFDREDFDRKAQEAQKKLEEKKAQMKEMEAKKQSLEKQKEELGRKQAEEKKRLREKLAAKSAGAGADADSQMADIETGGTPEDDANVSANTKLLRAKLAELEAEAKSLGIDQSADDHHAPRGRGLGRGRGRGSYRGWEGFAGRGSYDHYRGSPRGWGPFRGYGGGKYNLDLRTKKVGVSGVEWTSERDEALRQHLLGVGEFEAIDSHPEKPDTLIITFKERKTAEVFLYGPKEIPSIGKVEFGWYNAPVNNPTKPASMSGNGTVDMSGGGAGEDHEAEKGPVEVDYDVAEEDDRWD